MLSTSSSGEEENQEPLKEIRDRSFLGSGLARPRLADCALVAKSGSVLTLRTVSGVAAMQYTQVLAAQLGASVGAAHSISYQLWLTVGLLADAVAIAVQPLLAEALALEDAPRCRAVLLRAIILAVIVALCNSLILAGAGTALRKFFTSDPATLVEAAAIWPIALRSQVFTCAAFVCDGMLFAACDFSFCAIAMIIASAISIATQLALAPRLGLRGIWYGLELMMLLRFLTGAARIASRTGPWRYAFLRRPLPPPDDNSNDDDKEPSMTANPPEEEIGR